MKSFKKFVASACVALSAIGFTACNSDNTPSEPIYTLPLLSETFSFNSSNYWTDCYNTSVGEIHLGDTRFSHVAWADEWDGVSYPAWKGFCPSRVNDNTDHKGEWVNYQWGSLPSNPYRGIFLVGNSEAVVSSDPLSNNKCSMHLAYYQEFKPIYAYVTNSSYAYYCAKNGSDFNAPFTIDDNFVLNVVGVRSGVMTGHLKYPLMTNGMFLDQWAAISLESLGTVDEVLFYIDSTAKNSYGLTVPAYFCLGDFGYTLPSSL